MKTEKRTDPDRLSLRALINNLNNNDPALDELRADVRRLLNPPPIPAKVRSTMSPAGYWLRVIGKKIAAMMKMSTGGERSVMPMPIEDRLYLSQPDRRMRLGNEAFLYTPMLNPPANSRERKRWVVYWTLDQTLQSGAFSQVRICRQCLKFFTSYRRDAQACSPKCNSEYHNEKYQDQGKFMDAYFKRKKKRLNELKRLRHRGESRLEIIEQAKRVGLTELALIRAKVISSTKPAASRSGGSGA
jgi:hypothetical protein